MKRMAILTVLTLCLAFMIIPPSPVVSGDPSLEVVDVKQDIPPESDFSLELELTKGEVVTWAWTVDQYQLDFIIEDPEGDSFAELAAASQGGNFFTATLSGTWHLNWTNSQASSASYDYTVELTYSITVDNQPPTASIVPDKMGGNAPLTVEFDGEVLDVDGQVVDQYWMIRLLGENNPIIFQTDEENFTHVFTAPGKYNVTFNVTDDDGENGTNNITIDVNGPPRAIASADKVTPHVGEGVSFTGTGIDTDGLIIAYEWDFDDGGTSLLQNPRHPFTDPRTYNVKLTVFDDDGASGTDTIHITVMPIPVAQTGPTGADNASLEDGSMIGRINALITPGDATSPTYIHAKDGPVFYYLPATIELQHTDISGEPRYSGQTFTRNVPLTYHQIIMVYGCEIEIGCTGKYDYTQRDGTGNPILESADSYEFELKVLQGIAFVNGQFTTPTRASPSNPAIEVQSEQGKTTVGSVGVKLSPDASGGLFSAGISQDGNAVVEVFNGEVDVQVKESGATNPVVSKSIEPAANGAPQGVSIDRVDVNTDPDVERIDKNMATVSGDAEVEMTNDVIPMDVGTGQQLVIIDPDNVPNIKIEGNDTYDLEVKKFRKAEEEFETVKIEGIEAGGTDTFKIEEESIYLKTTSTDEKVIKITVEKGEKSYDVEIPLTENEENEITDIDMDEGTATVEITDEEGKKVTLEDMSSGSSKDDVVDEREKAEPKDSAKETFKEGESKDVTVGDKEVTVKVEKEDDDTVKADVGAAQDVKLEKDKPIMVDTDGDGKDDMEVVYKGEDENGDPIIEFTDVERKAEEGDNTMLYLGIGVVVLIIILVLVLVLRKKKPEEDYGTYEEEEYQEEEEEKVVVSDVSLGKKRKRPARKRPGKMKSEGKEPVKAEKEDLKEEDEEVEVKEEMIEEEVDEVVEVEEVVEVVEVEDESEVEIVEEENLEEAEDEGEEEYEDDVELVGEESLEEAGEEDEEEYAEEDTGDLVVMEEGGETEDEEGSGDEYEGMEEFRFLDEAGDADEEEDDIDQLFSSLDD